MPQGVNDLMERDAKSEKGRRESEALERLLTKVRIGTLSVAAAIGQLRTLPNEDLGLLQSITTGRYGGIPRGNFLRGKRQPDSRHCRHC